ncbi:ABC transporter permease [Aquisediminimonas sediminicola]|uniref:ABC transporter permease n=1 Tax=Alteraquisediminimonas sediminicola TaxID=2676787 RepID=UPI001C8D306C|nr:ABC transporter permease [Aquisediminimonas sediminicola]
MSKAALKLVGTEHEVTPNATNTPAASPQQAVPATRSPLNVSVWIARLKLPSPDKLFAALWPPVLGMSAFLLLWALAAPRIETSLGNLPGPYEVLDQFKVLWAEHVTARADAAAVISAGGMYSGSPTFIDQIFTSLETVAMGFILATLVAVPLGLLAGLSKTFNAAINPLVQVMKPVSPLAWLPIVTMVVSASITSTDPMLAKSFVISAITVMLCSLWPTLINTAVGVSSIDKDLLNVGRVLRLGWMAKLTKLVLPSAVPYIFTGMRLSLGVGWMVLIAAEMLAQNPGLGKFVWDEFQNGSEKSLARIMVAVIVIGLIGFALDRIMGAIQTFASRNAGR